MRRKKYLPKLHLACANDDLRPMMNHILITKDEIAASDAHVLIIHKTKSFFDEVSIKKMPERFLIHKNQWKEICKAHDSIEFDNNQIIVGYNNEYTISYDIIVESNYIPRDFVGLKVSGSYPNYNAVLPNEKTKKEVGAIAFNPDMINKLISAMFFPYTDVKNIKFEFYGPDRAIIVSPTSQDIEVKALLMPVMIS